jgi:hypothetical protein
MLLSSQFAASPYFKPSLLCRIQAQATEAAVAAFTSGDMVDAASVDEVRGMVTVLSATEAPAGIPSQALLQVSYIGASLGL